MTIGACTPHVHKLQRSICYAYVLQCTVHRALPVLVMYESRMHDDV